MVTKRNIFLTIVSAWCLTSWILYAMWFSDILTLGFMALNAASLTALIQLTEWWENHHQRQSLDLQGDGF